MTRPDQKEFEFNILRDFLEALLGKQNYHVNLGERPDFVLVINNKKIGIEVTHLFHKSPEKGFPLRQRESTWEKIIHKAKIELDAKKDVPVFVAIHFFQDKLPAKKDVPILVLSIVECVQKNIPSKSASKKISNRQFGERNLLSRYVRRIDITRNDFVKNFFTAPRFGASQKIGPDMIWAAISKKGRNVPEYYNKCDIVWLLISYQRAGLSSVFKIKPETLSLKYQSPFDKVFLFDSFRKRIYELNIEARIKL